MSGWFDRLRGREASQPETRLDAAEAERIARAAVDGLPFADALVLRGAWAEGSAPLAWHFWTPTIGSGLLVSVDDATGTPKVEQVVGR